MVRILNCAFEDAEYQKLFEKKDGLTWHNFIMSLTEEEKKDELPV